MAMLTVTTLSLLMFYVIVPSCVIGDSEEMAKLKQELADVHRVLETLKISYDRLLKQLHHTESMKNGLKIRQKRSNTPNLNDIGSKQGSLTFSSTNNQGVIFKRWGVRECPDDTELIYSGVAAGTHYGQSGGGANILCLPDVPSYNVTVAGLQVHRAVVTGGEYEGHDFPPFSHLANHDVACAVCKTSDRPHLIMVPGSVVCPDRTKGAWTLEYSGYLMTERSRYTSSHHRSEFICMDALAAGVPQSESDEDGLMFYPVERECTAENCGEYTRGYELACAVCTL